MKPNSTGRTDAVQWDGYSLILRGQRVFIHSGEFHQWRLPVPALWRDVLTKFRAAGLNAVSIYTHWGLIEPSRGQISFSGINALKPFFELCQELGLWVVVRPGPYINAETTAGGIAHWVTTEVPGRLRTNESEWWESWQGYVKAIIEETAPYQISEGGPVIAVQLDNEYAQTPDGAAYFQALVDAFKNSPIVVPLTYNDPHAGENFINGTGAVDIYGLDAYPQRFDCSRPDVWNPVDDTYHDYHMRVNPGQPWYMPEFQAGAFDPYGPSAPGYDKCRELTNAGFESVFYKSAWGANAKMMSYYMVYGGTSWGGLPFPEVYTSYDYGAAISEPRTLTSKYDELKAQGLFLRSSVNFTKTEWIGNSTNGVVDVTNPDVLVVELRNPESGSGFYIARQLNSSSTDTVKFNMTINTIEGPLPIPQTTDGIVLGGREAKVIVTDYFYGTLGYLYYSTAEIFFSGNIGDRDVLLAYGRSDQEHEIGVFGGHMLNIPPMSSASDGLTGLRAIFDVPGMLVLFADVPTAHTFFAPPLSGPPEDPFANFWGFGTNASVLVGGPYLVREAVIGEDKVIALTGDIEKDTIITVIGPEDMAGVTWNGEPVGCDPEAGERISNTGVCIGGLRLSPVVSKITVPKLEGWRYADSLPERALDFDDDDWIIADKTTTNAWRPPVYGDGRVLYGCDYGFCENVVLWRGHFEATGEEASVSLLINGGDAFAASVFLNGVFLGTAYGNSTNNLNIIAEVDAEYKFPNGVLQSGRDNVITIVQDNMGLEESGDEWEVDILRSPRGVRGFQLNPSGNFSDWKVQGKLGGYRAFPDKMRTITNEGGLFGEREGWHLPGFDTSAWVERALSDGLPDAHAGVGFFSTTFDLEIPEGFDVMLSFVFDDGVGETGVPYRALLFVNGWMMGKRVANLGPQAKFPVHEGILDYGGTNTVVVALWALEDQQVSPSLVLVVDKVFQGGVGRIATNNPTYSELRSVITLAPVLGAC
ncbi:glycoside hydrolase family 35 protein [Peniophora sp. CONT]|nr:glycoside hydrolase family 35 protein [Peniophora sp. CONT]